MNIVQLKSALLLAKTRNFAGAAARLNITQPTLSLQIQKLERHLGFQIFDRSKNPLEVTAAGKDFLEKAGEVVHSFEELDYRFRPREDSASGSISIGIIPTVASSLLIQLLPLLYEKYPKLDFRFFELPTHQVIRSIAAGEIEVGIAATPLREKQLTELPLYYEPFYLYIGPSHKIASAPVSLEEVRGEPVLILGEDHCFRAQTLKLCHNSSLGRIETGSFETLKKMVDAGLGITLLPELEEVTRPDAKLPLSPPVPVREVSLVHGPDFYKKDILKILHREILSLVPANLRERADRQIVGVID